VVQTLDTASRLDWMAVKYASRGAELMGGSIGGGPQGHTPRHPVERPTLSSKPTLVRSDSANTTSNAANRRGTCFHWAPPLNSQKRPVMECTLTPA
jgi:hypothetical protein